MAIKGQTVDKDTSQTVASSYLLSLPAGAISGSATNFVSPLSTELRELMETGKASTLQQAKDQVSAQLHVGADVLSDYLVSGNATLHTAAKNIAGLLMNQSTTLFANGESSAIDVNRYRTMTGTIFNNLSSLKMNNPQAVSDLNTMLGNYLTGIQQGQPFRNMSSAFRKPKPVAFTYVSCGPMGKTGISVITSASEWEAYYNGSYLTLPGLTPPPPPLPEVDFSKFYLIAVGDSVGAGLDHYAITGVQQSPFGINLQIDYAYLPSNIAWPMVITQETAVVMVPIFSGEVMITRYYTGVSF
jgi:hypothetical protein